MKTSLWWSRRLSIDHETTIKCFWCSCRLDLQHRGSGFGREASVHGYGNAIDLVDEQVIELYIENVTLDFLRARLPERMYAIYNRRVHDL